MSLAEEVPPFTLLRFRIAAPLYQLHEQTVPVPLRGGWAVAHFTVVGSSKDPSFTPVNAMLSILGDDAGFLHNTLVEVMLPGIVDTGMAPPPEMASAPSGVIEPPDWFFRPGGIPDAQTYAVNVLNVIIQHYRVLVGVPQIRPVAYKHARNFEFEFHRGDGTGSSGVFMAAGLTPKGEPANVPPANKETVAQIKESAKAGPLPLWLTLKMDAYADFDAGNLRSGLAHLYISFEMFAHSMCRRLGRVTPGETVVSEFLSPHGAEPPSVYKVVGYCHDLAGGRKVIGHSKTQTQRAMTALWKHRNDVLHGRPLILTQEIVESAVNSYAELAEWMSADFKSGEITAT